MPKGAPALAFIISRDISRESRRRRRKNLHSGRAVKKDCAISNTYELAR
jgi:hypothetical protein